MRSVLAEKQTLIALGSVVGIGPATLNRIINTSLLQHRSLTDFWQHSGVSLGVLNQRQRTALQAFKKRFTPASFYEYLHDLGITVLVHGDNNYPKSLLNIDKKPLILFTKGDILALQKPQIAVVGTRQPTGYGRVVTERLVKEIVGCDVGVVSGFMYGIDAIAHQTAVASGGNTVGVLGFGFTHMFPRSHRALAAEVIAAGGCLVSQFAPEVPPGRGTFPARNCLVAGLGEGVVVTEAPRKSGSHITAEYAWCQGKPVAAVPGPITSPVSEGTKWLINQGATMVSSGREVVELVGVRPSEASVREGHSFTNFQISAETRVVADVLQREASTLDQLVVQTQRPPTVLMSILTQWQLSGWVRQEGSIWYWVG